jgi:hypothetical protein
MNKFDVVRDIFGIATHSISQCKTVALCLFALAGGEAVGSDFMDRYILEHYPSSNVTQLRAYSCEELHGMCNWVEFKDAVLDKNCDEIYPVDTVKQEACLDVVGTETLYFERLRNCEKDRLSPNCLEDRRYKYSCDGVYSNEIERSVCKDIINVFSYCETLIYYDYEESFPACHKVIRDRKAFSKTGCKEHYSNEGPAVYYRCIDLFDDGRASGSRTKRGLNAAYKVHCDDITRRKEIEMEIFSNEFSCKMQTFWSSEDATLCKATYENECFSKAANVW